MNIYKHIYSIKEILNRYDIPNRNAITNLLIEHFLNIERANILGDLRRRNIRLSSYNYSTICVPMVLTNKEDCIEGCYILKSKYKIPEYIGNLIVRNGTVKLTQRPLHTAKYSKAALNKTDNIYYYIHDNYLYIEGTTAFEKVIVYGIFLSNKDLNDPEKADCECNHCVSDYDFRIDPELIDTLYKLVIKLILSTYVNKGAKEKDSENN